MSIILAAAVLPLVPILSDDARLDASRTYLSPDAAAALEEDSGPVYCLDRPRRERFRSICLTDAEWRLAIELAEAAPKQGPRAIVPQTGIHATGTPASLYGRGRW